MWSVSGQWARWGWRGRSILATWDIPNTVSSRPRPSVRGFDIINIFRRETLNGLVSQTFSASITRLDNVELILMNLS